MKLDSNEKINSQNIGIQSYCRNKLSLIQNYIKNNDTK